MIVSRKNIATKIMLGMGGANRASDGERMEKNARQRQKCYGCQFILRNLSIRNIKTDFPSSDQTVVEDVQCLIRNIQFTTKQCLLFISLHMSDKRESGNKEIMFTKNRECESFFSDRWNGKNFRSNILVLSCFFSPILWSAPTVLPL